METHQSNKVRLPRRGQNHFLVHFLQIWLDLTRSDKIHRGFVISSQNWPLPSSTTMKASIFIQDLRTLTVIYNSKLTIKQPTTQTNFISSLFSFFFSSKLSDGTPLSLSSVGSFLSLQKPVQILSLSSLSRLQGMVGRMGFNGGLKLGRNKEEEEENQEDNLSLFCLYGRLLSLSLSPKCSWKNEASRDQESSLQGDKKCHFPILRKKWFLGTLCRVTRDSLTYTALVRSDTVQTY